ncbi:carboxypeptidase-like regulatory domain-containing protein [Persicirhabdus sediminis]|uniref:Carboxypeptidase regulatory-like domain-containing protein n=1 Tax=Persicirhabdus sediminis TaxID=454144 RepID=A0A8J7MDD5_9BACT|nr:carboxypeptidase-like regulatory domain-containing protein [Persicirhabdus sediminis]MBK1791151.1 carboxypeptidase regulatory-like domain-containing protein [Persicirhabdus sediminis]
MMILQPCLAAGNVAERELGYRLVGLDGEALAGADWYLDVAHAGTGKLSSQRGVSNAAGDVIFKFSEAELVGGVDMTLTTSHAKYGTQFFNLYEDGSNEEFDRELRHRIHNDRLEVRFLKPDGQPASSLRINVSKLNSFGDSPAPDYQIQRDDRKVGLLSEVTNENGVVVFKNIPRGRYYLSHNSDEYAVLAGRRIPSLRLLTGSDHTVRLIEPASIVGKLLDRDGNGRAGVMVRSLHRNNSYFVASGSAITDGQGIYELKKLRPFSHYLWVDEGSSSPAEWNYSPVQIDLLEAGETRLLADIAPASLVNFSGRVVNSVSGEVIVDVPVRVLIENKKVGVRGNLLVMSLDANGEFSALLPAGEYKVSLRGQVTREERISRVASFQGGNLAGYDPAVTNGQHFLLELGKPQQVELKLRELDDDDYLLGEVIDEHGQPVAGAEVHYHDGGYQVLPADIALSELDGSFRLKYRKSFNAGEIKLFAYDGKYCSDLIIAQAGKPASLVLKQSEPARLSGRLVDPAGSPLVNVRITCDYGQLAGMMNSSPRFYQDAQAGMTDSDGRFELIKCWPAERMRIHLKCDGYDSDSIVSPELDAGADHDLGTCMLVPSVGVISGRVLDVNGDPLAHALVRAMTYTEGRVVDEYHALSNGDGSFLLENMSGVKVQLKVKDPYQPRRAVSTASALMGAENVVLRCDGKIKK